MGLLEQSYLLICGKQMQFKQEVMKCHILNESLMNGTV